MNKKLYKNKRNKEKQKKKLKRPQNLHCHGTYSVPELTGPKDLQGPITYTALGLAGPQDLQGLGSYRNLIFRWRTALSQLLQTFIYKISQGIFKNFRLRQVAYV